MVYKVDIKKKTLKELYKCPDRVQEKLVNLLNDLKDDGPIQKGWKNFSSLGKNRYHCHLTYHWVACWEYEEEKIRIEVYYVGSRENAPY